MSLGSSGSGTPGFSPPSGHIGTTGITRGNGIPSHGGTGAGSPVTVGPRQNVFMPISSPPPPQQHHHKPRWAPYNHQQLIRYDLLIFLCLYLINILN